MYGSLYLRGQSSWNEVVPASVIVVNLSLSLENSMPSLDSVRNLNQTNAP